MRENKPADIKDEAD